MFRKLLSSIGVGKAKVDTPLSAEPFVPGEPVSGKVHIEGGDEAQEFNRIYLSVATSYKHEDPTYEHTLSQYDVGERFIVGPKENRTIPFSFTLPYETPLSLRHRRVCSRPVSTSLAL